MILDSHLYNEGMRFNFEPFKFDGCEKKPSKFLIDFVCEDIEFDSHRSESSAKVYTIIRLEGGQKFLFGMWMVNIALERV